MKPFFIAVTFLSLFTILISCGEHGSDLRLQLKNPNEMTWTSDTLAYPGSYQTNMTSIWGSSSNDVWTCGHNDQSIGNLWHFNGTKWESYNLFKDIPSSSNSLFKVFGFSANNIWVVGNRVYDEYKPERTTVRKSLVLQYDGARWKEHNLFINGWITDVWGKNPSDLSVTGWGIVSNCNGTKWLSDTLNYPLDDGSFMLYDFKENSNGKCMTGLLSKNYGAIRTYFFFKKIDHSWAVIDSFNINSTQIINKFGLRLYLAGDGILYSFGIEGIYELKNEKWEKIKQTFSPIYAMIKLNSRNMIAVEDFGQVLFNDGSSWQQIQKLYNTKIVYRGIWSDGKEIFIVGMMAAESPQKTIIWHGR